jgi:UPF0176 protein
MNLSPPKPEFCVAALYRFCRLDDHESLREPMAAFCRGQGIKGTLLLASEGINGTVAGTSEAIAALIDTLASLPALAGLDVKYSSASEMPFYRMKVRLKREIVTMGVDGIDPTASAGTYVEASDWNALISHPDTVAIDTRNDYEVKLGTFEGAVDPQTHSFRDFPAWAEQHRDRFAGKKLAMFCTGGIRCEKATAYVKSLGFDEVFHLKGGILNYLEQIPTEQSLWRGECFVFDERVGVTHGLAEGEAELCRACRRPMTLEERRSPKYREGISCERCYDDRSDEDRARYAERQRQVELAAAQGRRLPIGN